MTIKKNREELYEALEKIFHEPSRLSIMSSLCAAPNGLTFTELKETCGLTDGNLNRHLKVLEEANAVDIDKKFIDNKPRTTIKVSRVGLKRFNEYLLALQDVLAEAQKALPAEKKTQGRITLGKAVRA